VAVGQPRRRPRHSFAVRRVVRRSPCRAPFAVSFFVQSSACPVAAQPEICPAPSGLPLSASCVFRGLRHVLPYFGPAVRTAITPLPPRASISTPPAAPVCDPWGPRRRLLLPCAGRWASHDPSEFTPEILDTLTLEWYIIYGVLDARVCVHGIFTGVFQAAAPLERADVCMQKTGLFSAGHSFLVALINTKSLHHEHKIYKSLHRGIDLKFRSIGLKQGQPRPAPRSRKTTDAQAEACLIRERWLRIWPYTWGAMRPRPGHTKVLRPGMAGDFLKRMGKKF